MTRSREPRIGINLTQFVPGKSGGVQSYVESLVKELVSAPTPYRYVLFANHDTISCFVSYRDVPRCEVVLVDIPVPRLLSAAGRLTKRIPFWAYTRGLRSLFAESGVDLMHFPMNYLIPIDTRGPTVVTSHDIQQEYYPEFFSKAELRWRAAHYRPSALRATHVVTISDYTKACLVDKYGVSPERVTTVHTGIEAEFFEELARGPRPAELPGRFFFYPAAFWPHKNHARLLRAVKLLVDREGFDLPLLLSGMDAADDAHVREEIRRLGLDDRVRLLGYVARPLLRSLYRFADFMVFPSLFEGFGIPVAEAMAAGCPVASSRATSLPELVGEDGLLFDPESEEEIARAISSLSHRPELRRSLGERGRVRARRFTGARMAEETAAVYERALTARH